MRHCKEELLRQQLLIYLCEVKQFPKSLIVQEKKISALPNVTRRCHINRRIDLLIYTPTFEPLLLIECKAISITGDAVKQVMGYNYYVGAPCIGIINQRECILQWKKDQPVIYPNWGAFPSYATCMTLYLKYV